MKKLMMFAAAMTIVGSAFAEVAAYDYKASVKNVDLKEAKVKYSGYTYDVVIKYVRSTSLYGYLIDACDQCDDVVDNGQGILVIANKADKGKVPHLMASQLQVNVWDPKFKVDMLGYIYSKTWEAEGYLWAEGFAGSTIGLFLGYNYPTTDGDFFDAWMDASGFGKALFGLNDSNCGRDTTCVGLDSLAGSVIGGMFLCHPNGYPFNVETFLCAGWAGTTDVITGTWSIKRNTKLAPLALTTDEAQFILINEDTSEYVKAAVKAINSNYGYLDVLPVAP